MRCKAHMRMSITTLPVPLSQLDDDIEELLRFLSFQLFAIFLFVGEKQNQNG